MMNRVKNPLHAGECSTAGRQNSGGVRVDDSVKDEIRARTPIAEFIGQYVPLRKRGNDLVGLCPFHGEKTPSFHVHPDRGFYKCFGCGENGDVFTFAQKIENLSFVDALRLLAGKAGVELQAETPGSARARSEKEAIYEANRIAAGFFARTLQSEAGAKARAYCENRGFSPATIEAFGLGYAAPGWDGLRDELERSGVDAGVAERAGLLKPSQRGGHYDFYRDRLMVPTFATTGEVIAFGGRALGDEEPKYLNTATTPVYTKGRHLFALNIAKRATQKDRTLIVVEGYLDCIALHQAGFENAVAALGTSFTDEQAAELRKYADNVFLCFDGDGAGNAAAFKAVDVAAKVLEHAGRSVRVVGLPAGSDPDSYVREHGAEGFARLLADAKPSIEFKLDPQIDRLRGGFDSPSAIARKAEELIRELTPREEWDRWRVYVAGRLKVNVDDLRNSRFFANGANFAPTYGASGAGGSRHVAAGVSPSSFEREVLSIIVEDPMLAREYGTRIEPDRFRNEVYRAFYERIVEQASRLRVTGDLYAMFENDQAGLDVLTDLGRRDRSGTRRYGDAAERRAHLDRVIERLQLDDEKRRYQELSHRIDELLTAGQPVSDALRCEFDTLVARLKR
jgi:DNA primase catalytic core